ncbi:MAG: hypothetical protein H0X03_06800, partial [Nitrosopumilus sp.]|nr:hypothetical protein [Nitrosopumilus sp.]
SNLNVNAARTIEQNSRRITEAVKESNLNNNSDNANTTTYSNTTTTNKQ